MIVLELVTCNPSIYTIDHPEFIVCNFIKMFPRVLRALLYKVHSREITEKDSKGEHHSCM